MMIKLDFASIKQELAPRFISLWQQCLLPGKSINVEQAWENLSTLYSEEHRLYHTLYHIRHCLRNFDMAKQYMDNANAVEMAIWYHDVIYVTRSSENEYQSTLYFKRAAGENLAADFVDNVCDLIMFTTHRAQPVTNDEKFICDIDLSSMAEPWKEFLADSEALRAECVSSEQEYALGKIKFFNSLLQRERVFYTDHFYSLLEENARVNLENYMELLNQKC